ncbi:tRNA pseudouridine(55) synthase TruB [Buchnera aphidicola (Hyadaphis tataricae)]|uniref:tRNA pseudouridine synthase B n=1 Tax=Buchnera aphidicola (Hyadaphis tataricae) TaxID=1241859 RepID=A0A4D6Y5P9_9GAMM|nr:tRNA pseudouridine(55) synthase TruB [Buchnera aphidicola]QCI21668.1 tRNA pseudouridine(55) synthase TruB [Buchnera aphidicola (Hyadaphis tataricae)]
MFFHKKRRVDGFLLLDKPHGISSNKALQIVKIIFHAKKAGYIGTLDPMATGVLPICFGECTKFAHYLTDLNKKYHVIAKFGEQTSTSDANGIVIKKRPICFSYMKLCLSIRKLTGLIDQTPPMHSAIKYNGIPLYKYAHQGLKIKRNARKVIIHKIDSIYKENNLINFTVLCSKGTYVRTLVEDLGEILGCGAHVVFLRRLQVGAYSHANLTTISNLNKLIEQQDINKNNDFQAIDNLLMPIDSPVYFLPKLHLSEKKSYNFKLGQSVVISSDIENVLVRVIEKNNIFLGLGKIIMKKILVPYRLVSIFQD